ncbi:unnamed protein product [Discosporangium mesarthrocarpum]
MQPSIQHLTLEACADWCVGRGQSVVGLQGGSHCFCGNDFGGPGHHRLPEKKCLEPCAGDPSQHCGGSTRNSIFR